MTQGENNEKGENAFQVMWSGNWDQDEEKRKREEYQEKHKPEPLITRKEHCPDWDEVTNGTDTWYRNTTTDDCVWNTSEIPKSKHDKQNDRRLLTAEELLARYHPRFVYRPIHKLLD